MASYTARKNKAGEIVSYQIKVSRGRDKLTGKQLTPFTTTYTPPDGWSKKAVERDLIRFMGEFEAACKRGEVLTKEEQKARTVEQIEQAKREQAEQEGKPTFKQYIEIFIQEKAARRGAVTVHNYRKELEKAAAVFGNMKMADIDFLTLKAYFIKLQADGKQKYTGKPLKIGSIIQHYTVLHSFFANAAENQVIAVSPMQNMKRPQPRKDEEIKQTRSFNIEEVQYILKCAEQEPLKWKAIIIFALDSGCRAGEIMGLKWSDIDFKTGKANICRNVQYTAETGVYISTPKNHKSREIFINPQALAVLLEWRKEQMLFFFRLGIPQSGFCFTTDNGEIMKPGAFSAYLQRFGKRYNLPDIHPHTLRHTMASLSLTEGADPVSVSKKLGHCDPSVTMRIYAHSNEEAQRRANAALAQAIYKNQKQA